MYHDSFINVCYINLIQVLVYNMTKTTPVANTIQIISLGKLIGFAANQFISYYAFTFIAN